MIRAVLIAVCLWMLAHGWHGGYRENSVARAVRAQDIANGTSGLVTVNGYIAETKDRSDGSAVLTLVGDGAQITIFAGPLVSPVPRAGAWASVTAKAVSPGLASLERWVAINPMPLGYQTGEGAPGTRVAVTVRRVQLLDPIKGGGKRRVWYETASGDQLANGLVGTSQAEQLQQVNPAELDGYVTAGGWFVIESWK